MFKIVTTYIERYKTQVKNLGVYFLAALIPMILSLLANPFIAKNMSPEDYAITGYYTAFSTLFSPLVSFYLLHYYTKRYFELNDSQRAELRATLFKSLIFFSCLMTVVALLIIFIYTEFFNKQSQIPFFPYAVLSMMSAPLAGIYTLTQNDNRMARASKKFFRLSVAKGFIVIAITLLFVVGFKWGATGKLSAVLIGSAIMFVYVLWYNRSLWKIPFNSKIFKDALLFCWPLVIASMLTFFSNGYDKVFLERMGNIEELGIYSVGVSIAYYLNVFATSINDTFQPDIFQSIVQRNYKRTAMFIGVKIAIMSICVIGFIIFAPFIIKVLTYGRYVNSTPYAVIISLSTITSMLYYSMSNVTVALGYTSITLTNKIIGSIASVVSFGFLINHFGAIGAAWGIVLSFVYFFLGNVILVIFKYRKEHKK